MTRIWRGSNYSFITGTYLARIGQNARFALPTKVGRKSKGILTNQYELVMKEKWLD